MVQDSEACPIGVDLEHRPEFVKSATLRGPVKGVAPQDQARTRAAPVGVCKSVRGD